MKTHIIVDSTTDLPKAAKDKVTVVPLAITFGTEQYIDGVTITQQQFYEKLIESDVIPTTSQASPGAFADVLAPIMEAGDEAVIITLASKLSGTYQSALIAAREYPDRVHVVDSCTAAIGAGILTRYALSLVEGGIGAREVARRITQERGNVQVIALLDTLEYLKKGGRISKTAAIAGGLLSIKPVVCIRDGEIVVLGKARGSKQGNNLLVKEIQSCGGVDFTKPLLMGYTGLSDIMLQKYIEDSAALWEGHVDSLESACIGSAIGTHAGPGAVAAAFFKKS